jgi:glycosyltransferase involved in cell wall biosynthesis
MVAPSVMIPEPVAQSIHQYEMAVRLVKAGVEVHLICRRPTATKQLNDGIIYHKILSKDFKFKRPFFTMDTIIYLNKLMKKENFDVVHDRGYLFGGMGTIVGKKRNLPVVLQIDDDWIETESLVSKIGNSVFYKSLAKQWCIYLLKRIDKAFTVSESLKHIVVERWGITESQDKISIIPNGADIEKFNPNREPLGIKQELGIENSKIVTFIGALGPWHGVNFLISSAPLVKKKMPEVKFLIVGGAKEYDTNYLNSLIEELDVKDTIFMLGRRPHEEIPRILVESDIAVAPYPNKDFGFSPLKIFEYMSSGCPVITSDLKVLHEIIEDGVDGELVKPEDPQELSEAICKLLNDGSYAKKLGLNARKKVKKKFSWDKTTERLINLYEEVL